MSIWDRAQKTVNEGEEFRPGDTSLPAINDVTNNSLYAVDLVNGLLAAPIVENPDPEADPTVEFAPYETTIEGVTKTLKKLKFTNIKGQRGARGEKGDKGDSAVSFKIGTVSTLPAGSSATATNVGTNQNVVLDMGIPKGDKGDAAILEFDRKPIKNSAKLVNSGSLYETFNPFIRGNYLELQLADFTANNGERIEEFYGGWYNVIVETVYNYQNSFSRVLHNLGIVFLSGFGSITGETIGVCYAYNNSGSTEINHMHPIVVSWNDRDKKFQIFPVTNDRELEPNTKIYLFQMNDVIDRYQT